jgi:ketosteroid isomerase-like protein
MPARDTLERFIALVESNAHDAAIEAFYTEDATMRENQGEPRRGRDTLVAHERAVLARAQSVESRCLRPVLVDCDHVVVHWWFRFEWPDGTYTEMDELALQRWRGERIAEEQFFYDPAQRARRPRA